MSGVRSVEEAPVLFAWPPEVLWLLSGGNDEFSTTLNDSWWISRAADLVTEQKCVHPNLARLHFAD